MNLGENDRIRNSSLPSQTPKNIFQDKEFIQFSKNLKELEKKYQISSKKIIELAKNPEIDLPLSIFSEKSLSSFESIVKYLHEEQKLNFSKIASITNRDQRTIWCTYNNAKKKQPNKTKIIKSFSIPIKTIQDRRFSVLESLVGFLKEEYDMTFSEISTHLRLDQRTVWTCYNRLKMKRIKNE